MCPGVVVKNTFLCVLDDIEASSLSSRASRVYRKARSDDVLCESSRISRDSGFVLGLGGSIFALDGAIAEESQQVETEDNGISDWMQALEAGRAEATAAITEIIDHAASLAFDPLGCHVVQRALEVAPPPQARLLASRFRGLVVDAARSPHAHFVLEKIVHQLGTGDASFIAQELQGSGRAVSLNIYGCGVVCRLLEFSAGEPGVVAIVEEVLAQDIASICCHKFGHRVAMSIISNGSFGQRIRVIAALRAGGLQRLARHRFAARVLEHALLQSSQTETKLLAQELMAQAGAVVSLACHSFGVRVVRGLLELPRESKIVLQYLQKACRKLRKDRFGMVLADELGLHDPVEGAVRAYAALGA